MDLIDMSLSVTPPTPRGEQAKEKLISAAINQFGEYGLHATTRDIAAAAGQNIAAIPYYFGSKEDLYMASAQWIADFIRTHFQPHADAAEALLRKPEPPPAAMRALIDDACRQMIQLMTADETLSVSKFISREQLSPSPAYQLIHEQVIAPLHHHFTRLIARLTGADPEATETVLHTHALIGEILAFRLGRETILLRAGWRGFDDDKAAQIHRVVTLHIDWILAGLSGSLSDE